MNWRTGLTIALCVVLYGKATGQTNMDPRIVELYGEVDAKRFYDFNPNLTELLTFWADHGYTVSEAPDKDLSTLPDVSSIPLVKPDGPTPQFEDDKPNILLYDLFGSTGQSQYYRVGDTNKVILLYAKNDVIQKYNNWRNDNP